MSDSANTTAPLAETIPSASDRAWMLKQADKYAVLARSACTNGHAIISRMHRDREWALLFVATIAEEAERASGLTKEQTPNEPRAKTLLRSMHAALDASDEATFWACFDEFQKVMLEMAEAATQGKP